MKQFLSITTLVLMAFAAFGSPVRSDEAAKGLSYIDEDVWNPTAADYIQDGLVNLWDAVENADWGVHTDYATSWTDLVGGFILQTGGGAIGDFTGGYMHYEATFFNGDGDPVTQQGNRYYDKMIALRYVLNTGLFTIEIVHRPRISRYTAWQKHNYGLRVLGRTNSHTSLGINCDGTVRLYSNILESGTTFPSSPMTDKIKESRTIVCDSAEGGIYSYLNALGDGSARLNPSAAWGVNISGPLMWLNSCIGFSQFTPYASWNNNDESSSDIYSFRIYNRPLTEDEIRYNHQIDKARFGL